MRTTKRRAISFVLSILLTLSLLPTAAIQAMAAGGTVDDYCGVNEPAQTYEINLNDSLSPEKIEAELNKISAAGYNDTVNITVSGSVKLPRQIINDKGATIHITGKGSGAALKADEKGLFSSATVADTSPVKNYMLNIGINSYYQSAIDVGNSKPDNILTIENVTLDGNDTCGILTADNHKISATNTVFQNGKLDISLQSVSLMGESITITGCTFDENEGPTNAGQNTGCLYLNTTSQNPNAIGEVTITGTTFSNNIGHSGGALYAYGDKTYVYVDSACRFEDNYAGQRGGAIMSHATIFVDGATFSGNTCGQLGGTVYISANEDNRGAKHYGTVVLNNVNITGSQAGSSGGGVYIADNGALFLCGDSKVSGNMVPENGKDSANNIFVQSVNSKVVCTNSFVAAENKVGISTSNPYSGKDVVISPSNVDETSPNYKLAVDHISGYDRGFDATTSEENIKSFQYDGEGFRIVDDDKNAGMMMLQFDSNTSDVVFDFNLPGAEAITYLNQPVGTQVNVPTVSSQSSSGVFYTFLGWYTDAEGGEKITTSTVETVAGLRVYYAHWEVSGGSGGGGEGEGDMYLVYFDQNFPNGGSGLTSSYCAAGTFTWTVEVDGESKTYTAKLPFALPEDPVRPGYQFLGWAESADATTANPSIQDGWVPTKQSTTLFAVWKAEEHTLTWNANGGQGGSTTTQAYDEVVVPPTTEPTREGYTFIGWFMDKNCSVALPGDMSVDGDRTFYAGWTSEKVVVRYYDTREGTNLVGTQEYHYGDVLTPLDPITDTSGQTFVRWETKDGTPSTAIKNLTSAVLTYQKGTDGDGIQSDAGYWFLDFYAVWQEETTDYVATVHWNDYQDNDGCRPQSVHLGLISSVNNREVAEATVPNDGNDTQTYTFTDLPITTADTSVEKITYSVYLKGYTDCNGTYREIKDTAASSGEIQGSTSSSFDDAVYSIYRYAINNFTTGATAASYSGAIYLDHDLITTRDDLKFSIQWDDEYDNDGMRPKAVTLVLYANGVKVQDVPLHNTGTGVVSASPAVCTVNEKGDVWTYTFQDYQKYHEGQAIEYTIAVVNDDQQGKFNQNGYTTKYLNSENDAVGDRNGAIISRPIDRVDKTVTIHWDDNSNRDKLRPDTVAVTLTAYQWNPGTYRWEQTLVDTATIQGDVTVDTWTYTFQQVKKYNGGQEIIYEASITSDLNAHISDKENGYTTVTNELDITASHNRVVKSVPVKIEWDDNQNNDTIRPKTVILQLYADGKKLEGAKYTVPFSGDVTADTWEYTFEDLPVYRDGEEGEEILYTFSVEEAVEDSLYGIYISTASGQEEEVVRYTASYMSADGETTEDLAQSAYPYVKLTHATDQGVINLYASWHDEQNRDGKRPSSIQVDLYKQVDGEKSFVKTYTITAGKNESWTYKVSGLPLYENGHEITYLAEVSEDFRENLKDTYGYTVSLEGPVVHLYYVPAVGYVTGHINWSDGNDNDNLRPDSVKGTLYANGKSTGKTLEFNTDNGWTQTWNDVDSYYNNSGTTGTPVTYSIVVETPDGYTVSYVPETTTTVDPQTIDITLTHNTDTTSIDATVYWNDNGNQDGERPQSVQVQLYANGKKVVGKTLELNGDGDIWTGAFTDLPIFQNGQKVDYTIQANDNVVKKYSALTAGMNLYLSRDVATADMSVSFRFDDGDNADGARPEALYLTLTANGEKVSEADYQKTVYFDVDGVKVSFAGLPVYSTEGEKISYNAVATLDEAFGGTDYTVSTSQDITLSTAGNTNQVIVTLKRSADVGIETGNVYWFDANNQRGNRPESIVIDVRSDAASYVVGTYTINGVTKEVTNEAGEVVGGVTVSEWGNDGASCWTYTIGGLTQNAIYNGQAHEVYYYATVRMPPISNWYTAVDGDSSGLDINLTHKNYVEDIPSSTQDFTVTVSWLDNTNAWGYRPDSNGVDVSLYANGTQYKSIHLTKADVMAANSNAWAYTFKNLPTYLNGSAVVWSVQIGEINMYTPSISGHSDYATIAMTQSIGFDFTTHWKDSDNDDAARPSSVTVEVYGDGRRVGEITLTGDGDTWTGSISDLAVWRESGESTPVSYSFQWSSDTNAALIDNYYTASATKDGNTVVSETFYYLSAAKWGDQASGMDELTGQYQWETTLTRDKETTTVYATVLWDDDANRDGKRPESIQVQLYANGEPVGKPKLLTGESTAGSWPIAWERMDVYEGGKKIVYTTQVVSVPDGYTTSVDTSGTQITLSHTPEKVSVTGTVNWDDSTEIHREYNSLGVLIKTYEQIARVDVYVQLLCNGEPLGEPVKFPAEGYQTEDPDKLAGFAAYTWDDLYQYANEGKSNTYTFRVYSKALDALLADGHSMAYDFETVYQPSATITHDLYDVRGSVYYLYDSSDDFLLAGVPVTAYLYNEETKNYTAVGSTVTDEDGKYELLNLPQGKLTVRATYQKDDYILAGSQGVRLDRCDNTANIVVNRDAQADSDLYLYRASGQAFYQTDVTDESTIKPVPEGSIVLLYKIQSDEGEVVYAGMTTTGQDGSYAFEKLASGSYLVNVVFTYEGSTYTYDNKDAMNDGLSFTISGADIKWGDIVKQVNSTVDPGPVDPDPDEPDPPVEEPEPCVVSGDVFFSDNGVHTTDPVSGVDVYLYSSANNAAVGQAETDQNGHWTAEGLPAGDFIAVFSYSGNASRVLHFTVSESDYEAGSYTAATQYFDRATKEPVSTIRGVALDQDGNRMSALVQILNERGEMIDFAYTDDVGAYHFTVPAGFTYRVKIVEVGTRTSTIKAGDPDDALTTLDYYTLTGNFAADGQAQQGSTVSLYRENNQGVFDLLTATLTDSKGDYSFQVTDAGNYRIVMYRDGKIYDTHNISVGYQEYEPVVVNGQNGTYLIRGTEAFDTAVLKSKEDNVVRVVGTLENNMRYSFPNLSAGTYILELTKDGSTKTYYLDAPDTVIDVSYHVTLSGKVLDDAGAPHLGAVVKVYDSSGKKVGEDTVVTDGSYSYSNLPADTYTIAISYPVAGMLLADKTTKNPDSFLQSYPDGMPEGASWVWNINAMTVKGTVQDQNGAPLEGVTVMLKQDNDPDKAYGCMTNEDGNWSVGVMPGTYTASAKYTFSDTYSYLSSNTVPVTVTVNDVDGVTLIIQRNTLTGTVVRDGDDQPLADAQVTLTYPDGSHVWTGKTNAEGKFQTPLYPDDYLITVEAEGNTVNQDVTLDQDKDLTIRVGTEILLSGTVYDTDGTTPVPDGIVYYQGPTSGKVYTEDDGTYTIRLTGKDLGSYTLYAEATGKRSQTATVKVSTDTTQNLTLEASTGTQHTISGIVTDNEGNRLANASVKLLFGNDKENTLVTSTSKDGSYRFDVANGTYYVTAMYEDRNGNTYSTNAETVVHVNGADETANLAVVWSYPVELSVVDTNGDPVDGATVTYTGASSGEQKVGTNGKATVQLAAGEYEFRASIGNRISESKTVLVENATKVELVVDLAGIKQEPPETESYDNTIRGTVLNPDDDPVKDAEVILWQFNMVTEEWEKIDSVKTAEDGSYEFTELSEGCFKVEVHYPLTHTANAEPSSYEIVGYAKDGNGNPYVGATVNLYLSNKLLSSVKTDVTGRYEFTNLKDDTYTVEIVPVGDSGGDKTITETKPATPSNAVIQGTVVDVNGDPVEGAVVTVSNTTGGSWSMTTEADGVYRFALPMDGEYTVKIVYLDQTVIETDGSYDPEEGDPISPELIRDSITIYGKVHDTDGNPVDNATVILKDEGGDELHRTTSAPDGYYEFVDLPPGKYTVIVVVDTAQQTYVVDTSKPQKPDPDVPEDPDKEKIRITGTIVTDHKKILANAMLTVTNQDTGKKFILYSDQKGQFDTGELDKARYEIVATYTHKYGSNRSDAFTTTQSQTDAVLVIVISYAADVNGDGKAETVYAGADDTLDTSDDFYPSDIDKDGKDELVYAGADKKPGTEDDYYPFDVDCDGAPEDVFVGEDRVPGTDDDYYLADPDENGTDDAIYAGSDGKPGTKDDWYEGDPDHDGDKEIVHVGEDGKPGTEDDWYEEDGNRIPVGVVKIHFNGNGGTVNGQTIFTVAKADLNSLPSASRANYTFDGWYTAPSGGSTVSLTDLQAQDVTTTVYAHWTKTSSGGTGGGGGGGGGTVTPPEESDQITVTIQAGTGTVVTPNGTQTVEKGDDLTIVIEAAPGYVITDVLVDGVSRGDLTTFTLHNITKSHTVEVLAERQSMLTDEHIAYISGYPDGSVRPNTSITRAEVATIFYRLLNEETRVANETTVSSFTDVPDGSWYETAVATLAKLDILKGYADGTFHPNANITRAEFATIASRFDDLESSSKTFTDVPVTHWAYEAIASATEKGWVNGYEDGSFKPEKAITRAETMTLVNRVLGRDTLQLGSLLDGMKTWPDAVSSDWFYLAVQEATNSHDAQEKDGVEIWTELK